MPRGLPPGVSRRGRPGFCGDNPDPPQRSRHGVRFQQRLLGVVHEGREPRSPDSGAPLDHAAGGRRLSADQVLAIAARLPRMKQIEREYRGAYAGAYLKPAFHWQVSYFSKGGKKEVGQIIIDDLSGRVLEQWTGFQVAWTMARGYPGAFGRHVNALYIWLPLCVLFLVPFLNCRRPFSLINLDLLVLLSFSVSLAYFNHGRIGLSVPLAYPPLLYLLARMLALLRRPREGNGPGPLRLLVPASWLALAVIFLLGFRIALNVTDSNVVDVGYAGVIGAQRIGQDRPLYGNYPSDNEHGDTYGPVNYEAYVPAQQVFGGGNAWDDLPAAHGAAILFDVLAVALLFLLGRRMRGPTLGIALAYAWVSFPFTLFALESNTNDTLVAVLILAALLAATYRSNLSVAGRGAMAALAGLTKFAPLALAPLLATDAPAPAARSPPAPRLRDLHRGVRRARERSHSVPRSPTTRCTRSTSGRSPTRATATRPSRSGASTAEGRARKSWRSPPSPSR